MQDRATAGTPVTAGAPDRLNQIVLPTLGRATTVIWSEPLVSAGSRAKHLDAAARHLSQTYARSEELLGGAVTYRKPVPGTKSRGSEPSPAAWTDGKMIPSRRMALSVARKSAIAWVARYSEGSSSGITGLA